VVNIRNVLLLRSARVGDAGRRGDGLFNGVVVNEGGERRAKPVDVAAVGHGPRGGVDEHSFAGMGHAEVLRYDGRIVDEDGNVVADGVGFLGQLLTVHAQVAVNPEKHNALRLEFLLESSQCRQIRRGFRARGCCRIDDDGLGIGVSGQFVRSAVMVHQAKIIYGLDEFVGRHRLVGRVGLGVDGICRGQGRGNGDSGEDRSMVAETHNFFPLKCLHGSSTAHGWFAHGAAFGG